MMYFSNISFKSFYKKIDFFFGKKWKNAKNHGEGHAWERCKKSGYCG